MKPKKIKILHIITQLDLGGAQKNALDIVRLLDKNRYAIYFVSSNKGLLLKETLHTPGVKTVFLPSLKRSINLLADLLTLFRLTLLFKKEHIELVHTHSSKAGILGRWAAHLAGVPVIVHTIHGWSFHNGLNSLMNSLYIFLERITAKFTNNLIAVSFSDIQKGLNNKIATKDKYVLIRYGIAREEFINRNIDIERKKKELGLDVNSSLVGMAACLKPQKSPQDFVRVASLVIKKRPQTQFLLVGDGLLRKEIERLIDSLNLKENFILTGWRRDIPEIMSILDVFVLTSLWEGLPIALLEAMACALPVVVTSAGGTQELVNNGVNGFLVSLGDAQTMAERIGVLLENKPLACKMGQEGKRLLNSTFTAGYMAREIDKVYQTLAKRSKLCQAVSSPF